MGAPGHDFETWEYHYDGGAQQGRIPPHVNKWIPLRTIKPHARMMSLGKIFFEVDSEQKTSRNRGYPHPL
jgi:hypothetical protein